VDEAIAREAKDKKDAETRLSQLFTGSGKVELLEKGDGLMLTARFNSLDELRAVVNRIDPGTANAK
jgi:NNP family nitrate/nitrite transporter-like MFS transporter